MLSPLPPNIHNTFAYLRTFEYNDRYQASGDNNSAAADIPGADRGTDPTSTTVSGAGADASSGLAADIGGSGLGGEGGAGAVSPLAQFLIERACNSLELANFFYWYLRVDLEDATHGHVFRGVQAAFWKAMRQTPESSRLMGRGILGSEEAGAGAARRRVLCVCVGGQCLDWSPFCRDVMRFGLG